MYITYGKVFGGTPNICMFSLFSENGSISDRTINRALIVLIQLLKLVSSADWSKVHHVTNGILSNDQ